MRKHLTHRVAEATRPLSEQREFFIWDDELKGFGLRVGRTGSKSWVFQAVALPSPKPQRMSLGPFPAVSVGIARDKAAQARGTIAAGGDPFAGHQVAAAAITLGTFIDHHYLPHAEAHKKSWRDDQGDLRRYLPPAWRTRALDSFSTNDMVQLHIALGQRGHYISNALLRLLRAMFNCARTGATCRRLTSIQCESWTGIQSTSASDFLTLEEFDRLMVVLAAEPEALWRDYFTMCLLTAQRRNEVARMTWEELDLNTGIWILPAARTKANRASHIPLTTQVLSILARRRAA